MIPAFVVLLSVGLVASANVKRDIHPLRELTCDQLPSETFKYSMISLQMELLYIFKAENESNRDSLFKSMDLASEFAKTRKERITSIVDEWKKNPVGRTEELEADRHIAGNLVRTAELIRRYAECKKLDAIQLGKKLYEMVFDKEYRELYSADKEERIAGVIQSLS